jgi:hypothetical protein
MRLHIITALAAALLLTSAASAQFAVNWFTIDGGGGTSTGGTFSVSGTVGQPDAGAMTGGTYMLYGGFWTVTAVSNVKKGDLNCDGVVDFKDINPFVLLLSNPGAWQATYPACPMSNGDCNNDGIVDFKDINPFVAILSGGL